MLCIFVLWLSLLTGYQDVFADDISPTGQRVTFHPSALMISKQATPLLFFSETTLMNLAIDLPVLQARAVYRMESNCSQLHQEFFDDLLTRITHTQQTIHRVISLPGFSNLLECDTYLHRYYRYSTGIVSRMICPRTYQPSLHDCKVWALEAITNISPTERMFLMSSQRTRRSSWMCHAGFFLAFSAKFTRRWVTPASRTMSLTYLSR